VAGHRLRRPCLALYFRVMSTPSFDTGSPNVARMYDYWLGGTDNFEADRQAAAAVRKIRPNVAEQALDNKRFQTRAVTYVAGHGVRQFLDVGSGLPTSPAQAPGAAPQWLATHEADWLPGQPETALGDRESMIVAGVARRPLMSQSRPATS
jgi:S-adenosyl methyltransferase